ncbi:serine/arginine repetitive matrix protein 1 isoform X1 [Amborella trichopoda]|uniref:serine/arginine repetitive matrix protein 1 isoform X1 n=1 Tax=Amborella trichopoda TaxID=13333 RepID=UPI0005D3CD36|nr:serine/arginine repetitive matrix protein 1 isoform X1 [Amborella trichopoda]XP_011628434.1 serine/arginine repetitive matrix protein 1 isoform X1 [Amborella trichopoda]XP_020531567.1 serine/arginine repetitive matrix protein 1 isoform X1 [Amborella trichopoda]|eukprot:XP_011628433.1 serine/arginine repetitive matrix protein 1 isoform X1 [Amborella trichopoda]
MSPSVNPRSPARRSSSDWSGSPPRRQSSPYPRPSRRRSPPRKENFLFGRRTSPRLRSPDRGTYHRTRSPTTEKVRSQNRSPNYLRSPVRSGSPYARPSSPSTKHLRRAQEEREVDELRDREPKGSKNVMSGSPRSQSPSLRTKHLRQARAERGMDKSRDGEYKKSKNARSGSPHLQSPSPRTIRLRQAQAEREADKLTDRGQKKSNNLRVGSPHSRSPSPRAKHLRRPQEEREADKLRDRNHKRSSIVRSGSPDSQSPSPRTMRIRRAQEEREADKLRDSEYKKRNNVRSGSPYSRSPSPHAKHLKRAHAERELDKSDREHRRSDNKDDDRGRHRERGSDKDLSVERKSMRDMRDDFSSRSKHGRSISPRDRGHWNKRGSESPPRIANDYGKDHHQSAKAGARDEVAHQRGEQQRDGNNDSLAKMKAAEEALETKPKQQPSFELSGKLAAETNRVRGVTLLFTEPPEARKPDIRWRLYVFKAGEVLKEPLYVHRQSCYLFGRERRVADIPTDHPSCSKQHAVLQYRLVEKEEPDGMLSKQPRICNSARELCLMMRWVMTNDQASLPWFWFMCRAAEVFNYVLFFCHHVVFMGLSFSKFLSDGYVAWILEVCDIYALFSISQNLVCRLGFFLLKISVEFCIILI